MSLEGLEEERGVFYVFERSFWRMYCSGSRVEAGRLVRRL